MKFILWNEFKNRKFVHRFPIHNYSPPMSQNSNGKNITISFTWKKKTFFKKVTPSRLVVSAHSRPTTRLEPPPPIEIDVTILVDRRLLTNMLVW